LKKTGYIEAVVDALSLPKFAMYGFSAGGRLALHYYAKHSNRVSHLVFFGTSASAAVEERMKQRNIQLAVIRASWEIGSKVWAERLMQFGGSRDDIERIARWLRSL
jgi:pimeloyl-ACP methyl ester carboxylesterase